MVDITKRGISMIAGVSEALKFKKQNPNASDDEIMQFVLNKSRNIQLQESKVDVVAGVSHALKILAREPGLKDREIIERVMQEMKTIMPRN